MKVEVVYAFADKQTLLSLDVDANCNAEQAIQQSGILNLHPDIDLGQQMIGIFSKPIALTQKLKENDRVEIYRQLTMDPKDARRLKATS